MKADPFTADLETVINVVAERRGLDVTARAERRGLTGDTVITYELPPGWLPPAELQPLLKAVRELEWSPCSQQPTEREIKAAAGALAGKLKKTESFLQQAIRDPEIGELLQRYGAERLRAMTKAKDAADATALRIAERRAAFSARLAALKAAKADAARPIPADPRTAPTTPPRRLHTLSWRDQVLARKRERRRLLVASIRYRNKVRDALNAPPVPTRYR